MNCLFWFWFYVCVFLDLANLWFVLVAIVWQTVLILSCFDLIGCV